MKRRANESDIAGVLPVYKPAGPTSHDVVQVARRSLRLRQIGHTGTLDPAATGVLVLCLGPYTKLVPYLTESDKEYRGWIGLGIETTTDDREGEPLTVADARDATLERIRQHVVRLTGDIEQMPPRYAAVKVAGRKLYEYAREGQEVEVEPRQVTVHRFEVEAVEPLSPDDPAVAPVLERAQNGSSAEAARRHRDSLVRVSFITRVSSGTYVRSLARDLGRMLGCGGYLASLTRTAVGRFDESTVMSYEAMRDRPEEAEKYLLRGAAALDSDRFPVLRLLKAYEERLLRGQPLHEKMMENAGEAANLASGSVVGVASEDGAVLLAMMQAESFQAQMRENPYGSRFACHFRPLRVFPGGLK